MSAVSVLRVVLEPDKEGMNSCQKIRAKPAHVATVHKSKRRRWPVCKVSIRGVFYTFLTALAIVTFPAFVVLLMAGFHLLTIDKCEEFDQNIYEGVCVQR